MTSRELWTSLAERVEKAGGADREIERAIHTLRTGEETYALDSGGWLPVTASVDAVLELISETLPGAEWRYSSTIATANIYPADYDQALNPNDVESDVCETPALALLAAYCRCRAASVIEIAGSGERDG